MSKSLRQLFPSTKLFYELYLYSVKTSDFLLKKELAVEYEEYLLADAIVVVGKWYSTIQKYWLQKVFQAEKLKPDVVITPVYDLREVNSLLYEEREYEVGIFDTFSPPHRTAEALMAFQGSNLSVSYSLKAVKRKEMLDEIQDVLWRSNYHRNDFGYPHNNVSWSSCKVGIALYEPEVKESVVLMENRLIYNFLTSIRVVEILANGCLPIVSDSLANMEIFGKAELLKPFAIEVGESSEKLRTTLLSRAERMLAKPEYYFELLRKIDVERFSNVENTRRILELYEKVS